MKIDIRFSAAVEEEPLLVVADPMPLRQPTRMYKTNSLFISYLLPWISLCFWGGYQTFLLLTV